MSERSFNPLGVGLAGPTGPTGPTGGPTGRTYFFDPSTASDIPGYFVASPTPSANPETTILQNNVGTGFTLIATFATPIGDPSVTSIPAGIAARLVHAMTGATNQFGRLRLEVYRRTSGGVETLLRTDDSHTFGGALQEVNWSAIYATSTAFDITDRLVFRLYTARVSGPAVCAITCYFDGATNVSYAVTTIPAPGFPSQVAFPLVAGNQLTQALVADPIGGGPFNPAAIQQTGQGLTREIAFAAQLYVPLGTGEVTLYDVDDAVVVATVTSASATPDEQEQVLAIGAAAPGVIPRRNTRCVPGSLPEPLAPATSSPSSGLGSSSRTPEW